MKELSLYPITKEADISFIKSEDNKFRAILNASLNAEEEDIM